MNIDSFDRLWLIDKPLQWSSFDVVNKLRNILRKASGNKKLKVGHAGTLDPLATGLLLVASGQCTKKIDSMMGLDKEYTATICFGATTPSYDTETFPEFFEDTSIIAIQELKSVINKSFTGKFLQIPPSFSAIKVNGQRAYTLARQGQNDLNIPERLVEVKEFSVLSSHIFTIHEIFQSFYSVSDLNQNNKTSYKQIVNSQTIARFEGSLTKMLVVNVSIRCSKGTYIRSIARDLAKAIGTEGYLLALRRHSIGDYNVQNSVNLFDNNKQSLVI